VGIEEQGLAVFDWQSSLGLIEIANVDLLAFDDAISREDGDPAVLMHKSNLGIRSAAGVMVHRDQQGWSVEVGV
jgi:hypothetical protein